MTEMKSAHTCTHKDYKILIELLDDVKLKDRSRVMLSVYSKTNGLIYVHTNGGTLDINKTLAIRAIKKYEKEQEWLKNTNQK